MLNAQSLEINRWTLNPAPETGETASAAEGGVLVSDQSLITQSRRPACQFVGLMASHFVLGATAMPMKFVNG
jgi:hypothetical protein